LKNMTWFEYMVSFIVGIIGLLWLAAWIRVVYEAIVSDSPITFEGVILSCFGLVMLAFILAFFATYIYMRCYLKGLTKGGEHTICNLAFTKDFSIFDVKWFIGSLSELIGLGSPCVTKRLRWLSKLLFKSDETQLNRTYKRNEEELAELKKNHPWLVRLGYLALIEGLIFCACLILMLLTSK
jgi:hypothetical protein